MSRMLRFIARLFFPAHPAQSALAERADVLAYIERRRRAAKTMRANSVEFADEARVAIRQLDVMLQDISHGLHEGEAQVAAAIAGTERELS